MKYYNFLSTQIRYKVKGDVQKNLNTRKIVILSSIIAMKVIHFFTEKQHSDDTRQKLMRNKLNRIKIEYCVNL